MSLPNQAFWTGKRAGCSNDGEVKCDSSSRIESKRASPWFADGPEVDMLPNKKQALEAPNTSFLGLLNSNIPPWGNSSSFHSSSGHFTEQLFDSDAAAAMNFGNANISSVSADSKLSLGRKDNMDPFGSDSYFGLSMSALLQDPRLFITHDGSGKAKFNEVKESENVMSVPSENPYDRGVCDAISNSHEYNGGDSSISTSLTYNKGDAGIVSMNDSYDRTGNSLVSTGQSFNKGDESLSIHPIYKELCNPMSMDQGFSKVDSNLISVAQAYKVNDHSMLSNHLFGKVDDSTISMGHTYIKGGNNMPLVSHSYKKGESTIISFGGCDDDVTTPSDLFTSNYELLMGQASFYKPEALNEHGLVRSCSSLLPCTAQASAPETESVPKTKDEIKMSKKSTSNNFPSNVRSLLSTGMLDGVSVKYKAWSREKELRAVIKGAGYLCSCQSCNFSKVINAYELERHAGCKTKHPNNHIYFDNGKTIYGVVQELRSTPQNMLFEVIQTVTGSPINQQSFRIWKESFLAAARELQRICGNNDVKQLL